MSRFFNGRQKRALMRIADGKCERCGSDETPEADHVKPFASGGSTAVENGQILCRRCNLQKGGRVDDRYLWQERFSDDYFKKDSRVYTLQVSPGGGKTRGTIKVIHELLRLGYSPVVIVSPSLGVAEQWRDAAAKHSGIQFLTDIDSRLSARFQGYSVVYQALANRDEDIRKLNSGGVLVLDEFHHLCDRMTWGRCAANAAASAARIIAVSGTLWRKQGEIPFATYDDDGMVSADFTLSYVEALSSRIVRPVEFIRFDGDGTKAIVSSGEIVAFNLEDGTGRANDVLDPEKGDFCLNLLTAFAERLGWCQSKVDSASGGLVVARSIPHARQLQRICEQLGLSTFLVHSDDPLSWAAIKKFRQGQRDVIVSVRMVSEGVDIPRLRCLAHLTNIEADLALWQLVARVWRHDPKKKKDGYAYAFVPNTPAINAFADSIEDDVRHFLQLPEETPHDPPIDPTDPPVPLSEILSNSGGLAGVTGRGECFEPDEIGRSENLIRLLNLQHSPSEVARALRESTKPREATEITSNVPEEDGLKRLKSESSRRIGYWSRLTGLPHKELQAQANSFVGVRSVEGSSDIDLLRRRLDYVEQQIAEAKG